MDLGSSTELITLKPWSTGKQLPLGFSVLGQGDTAILLQRVMALAKDLKQQVTWRRFPVRLELYEESAKPQAASHKLATIGEYKKL